MPIFLRPVKLKGDEKKRYKGFRGAIIVVYSDVYLDLFFARHCLRKHQLSEFTVVVIGEEGFPTKRDIKVELEKLLIKDLILKKGTLFSELSSPYFARIWSLKKGWFSDEVPANALLRFEDCNTVSYANLERLQKQSIVTQNDIDKIKEIRRDAEKNKLFIKDAWFIGHIDVIKKK